MRLAERDLICGHVLDVGCGTGEHALMAAELGLSVTAVDVAPSAIRLAERKAHDRKIDVRFLEMDALDLRALDERYDTVLDSGVFHVFDDPDRARFVDSVSAVTAPAGLYHLLCFSEHQPGDWGPRRVSESEIRGSFAEGWVVETIEPTIFEITLAPDGAQAWLASIRRL